MFDAIVVGSRATGGWAAKELTEARLRVVVVETGRNLDPARDITRHGINPFGHAIHEVGIARMGNDPKKSALN